MALQLPSLVRLSASEGEPPPFPPVVFSLFTINHLNKTPILFYD